ncbi:MAG: type II secretion system protein [Acidobacteria bacterium]|nr:type II secretion system protein [Acidobacteriota bacterium]
MRRRIRETLNTASESGFSLFELIVTMSILGILVIGTIPLSQNAVKRQKEIKLRETLRQVRAAIDEFKRDTTGGCNQVTGNNTDQRGGRNYAPTDPRSRVVIDDCTIFTVDNLDRYPPTLETLVKGVKVRDRGLSSALTGGGGLGDSKVQATELNDLDEQTKIYLRHLPVDPITGESDWKFRSSYQAGDEESWDDINVFDLRSASDETALDGTKYSEW